MTELGAYLDRPLPEETAEERKDLRRWLTGIFGKLVDDLPGADVFYGSAATRLFQPALDAAPFVNGLLRTHPGADFHCTDSRWVGARMLGIKNRSGHKAGFAVRLATKAIAASLGNLYLQAKEWRAGAKPRQLLRELVARDSPDPNLWVALVSDWPRFNRHLIDGVVMPARESGRSIGVLLLSTVLLGTRNERNLAEREGTAQWPGLGPLATEVSTLPLDQLVTPTEALPTLAVLARAAVASARATAHAVASGPSVRLGAGTVDLSLHVWELAKLLTIDVHRALAAARATDTFAQRASLRDRCVLLSAGSLSPYSAADLALQRAGAITVEVYHGAGMEGWIGGQESRSNWRALFTAADAETVSSLGQKAVVGGMPRRQSPRAVRPPRPPRVLFLSNYCHRDYEVEGRFSFECFQNELLSVSELVSARFPEIELRWRPHPADNEAAIARSQERFPRVRRTTNKSLEADFEWADVLVSSMSTTVLEGLFLDLPVFIHIPPEYRAGPNARRYDPRRVFFYRDEGIEKLAPIVDALLQKREVDVSIEARTRTAFFGPSGQPESLIEALRAAGLKI